MKGGEGMIFGVLKDIKNGEYRVIATPAEVGVLVSDGHTVLVQAGAGAKAGFPDAEYAAAGAQIVGTMEEIYAKCDFAAKVKGKKDLVFAVRRLSQTRMVKIHVEPDDDAAKDKGEKSK